MSEKSEWDLPEAMRYALWAREQNVRRRVKRNRIESMLLFLGCFPEEIYENDRRQIVVVLPVAP